MANSAIGATYLAGSTDPKDRHVHVAARRREAVALSRSSPAAAHPK
ncbi:MAG TPA: hypothetical protein VFP17_03140 [Solirubrobacterales bacterium]|nr:hypothetical protein [Solirubrobacterales bacterium]